MIKGALSGLRPFLAAENPFKMTRNAFYFTSKALCVLKIFKFLSWLFGRVAKRLDKKDKVKFKFYDFIVWVTNNCNLHIAKYLKKEGNQTTKFGQLTECTMRNIYLEKLYTKCDKGTSTRPFSEKLKLNIALDQ